MNSEWASWDSFKLFLTNMNEYTKKGHIFAIFSYYLLKLHSNYNYYIDEIWHYSDFPNEDKTKLCLHLNDKGTDLIIKKKKEYCVNNQYISVQCKFLSNENNYYCPCYIIMKNPMMMNFFLYQILLRLWPK